MDKKQFFVISCSPSESQDHIANFTVYQLNVRMSSCHENAPEVHIEKKPPHRHHSAVAGGLSGQLRCREAC
jgi:hypothetical protein